MLLELEVDGDDVAVGALKVKKTAHSHVVNAVESRLEISTSGMTAPLAAHCVI